MNTKVSDELTSYSTRYRHQRNWQQWAFSWGHHYFVHVRHISWLKKTIKKQASPHHYIYTTYFSNVATYKKNLPMHWSQTVFIVKLSSLCGMNQGGKIKMTLKSSWNFSSITTHIFLCMEMIFCVSFKGCIWKSPQNNPFIERYDFTHSLNFKDS